MQVYSDPRREEMPHALPNIEVFHIDGDGRDSFGNPFVLPHEPGEQAFGLPEGWYWWACFPGCLPDSDPNGPFETDDEAAADAQDEAWDDDEGEPLVLPPHIEVYVTGIAKCFRCGERLYGWDEGAELQEWVDEHAHPDKL